MNVTKMRKTDLLQTFFESCKARKEATVEEVDWEITDAEMQLMWSIWDDHGWEDQVLNIACEQITGDWQF